MSTFNLLVPPLHLAPIFLRAINWAQPDDTEKRYPIMGRIRYAWLSEDLKNIKVLLKDGPDSWSEEKPEIMEQIKSHETFVSVEVLKRDPVYLVAEFKPLDEHYDEHFKALILNNFSVKMKKLQEISPESFTKDPFDIYDEGIKKLESGDAETLKKLKPIADSLMSAIKDGNSGVIRVGENTIETQTADEYRDEIVKKKKSVMENAVAQEKYERAAEIRDEISEINKGQ